MGGTTVVLSCEHAGHRVPRRWARLFEGAEAVLASHRGWDRGSLELARALSTATGAEPIVTTISRLIVETNRSLGHARLFSEFTRDLADPEKRELLERYYHPHRDAVAAAVEAILATGADALHISVHTFTPELDGELRRADVALLYDPRRPREREAASRWLDALTEQRPDLRLRRNYPYRGASDGLTTALRRRFPAEHYLGLELEVNQLWPGRGGRAWRRLREDVARALLAGLDE